MNPSRMNALKLSRSLSYRVAMRRNSLSRPMRRSTTFRRRYVCLSNPLAEAGYFPSGRFLWGITGSPPRERIAFRNEPLSYALSAAICPNRQRGGPGLPPMDTLSRSFVPWGHSWCCPGVSRAATGLPAPSQRAWSLVVSPPRLRPKACLSRLSSGVQPLFPHLPHSCEPEPRYRRAPRSRNRDGPLSGLWPRAHRGCAARAQSPASAEIGRRRSSTARIARAGPATVHQSVGSTRSRSALGDGTCTGSPLCRFVPAATAVGSARTARPSSRTVQSRHAPRCGEFLRVSRGMVWTIDLFASGFKPGLSDTA